MSGNNNNNNNNNNNPDKSKERARQEGTILQDFMQTTQRRVERLRQSSSTASTSLDLSPGERQILRQVQNAGMLQGIAAGTLSFVVLRRFPPYLKQRYAKSSSGSSGCGAGYKLDVPGPPKSPFSNSSSSSNGIPPLPPPPRAGLFTRALGFTVDVTLSFMVAAYASFYAADRQQLAQAVVEIPLMEGRSAISDHFCADLVKEYHRQLALNANTSTNTTTTTNSDDDDMVVMMSRGKSIGPGASSSFVRPSDRRAVLLQTGDLQNPILGAYVAFIRNCQQRQRLEHRIRQQQGLASTDPVEIPSPGVPKPSDAVDGAWDFFDDTTDMDDDEFMMDGFSKDDATSFVADQDDDDKHNNNNNNNNN